MKSRSRSAARGSDAARSGLTLAGFLPYRLNVMATAVSEGLARVYGERFGIGIPEWRVLATIGEFGSITAKAISAHARMSKVKVSRAAASLEEKGLIRRLANPADLRESFLVLSSQGGRVYDEIAPLALAYVAELTEGVEAAELEILDALVTRLTDRAEAMQAARRGGRPTEE